MTDSEAMDLALAQARLALDAGEVPVGAVVLRDGAVVGLGRNAPIGARDPTAHAEVVAMRAAAAALGNYRLDGCELFVTLEPCAMCSGAMLHARLARVVYGAADPKTGAAGSAVDLFGLKQLNHQTVVRSGVQADACAALLRGFFQQRRVLGRARHPLREDALRTPDEKFSDVSGYPWGPHYVSDLPSLSGLRMHYVDEGGTGPATPLTFLCLHGHETWSYVFRSMLAAWSQAGQRVVAPDLIGFGKSDKPKKTSIHTRAWHGLVLQEFIERLDLRNIVLVLQGSAGLVCADLLVQDPARYRAIVVVDAELTRAGLLLPGDTRTMTAAWKLATNVDIAAMLQAPATRSRDADAKAWAAPFPDQGHRAGPQALAKMALDGHGLLPPWQAAVLAPPAGATRLSDIAQHVLDVLQDSAT